MKILHIISSGGMYGAESVILNLTRILNEQGHTSTLGVFVNSANPNHQLYEAATREGIRVDRISCVGQLDRTVPAAIRALADAVSADVVHAHGYKGDIYTWAALRGAKPLVSTCHNWLDDNLTVRLYGALDRLALRSYSAVVAVSEPVRQRLIASGLRARRIHLIRNGIDLRPFQSATPSLRSDAAAFHIGISGRLSREKGVDIFLQAISRLKASHISGRPLRFFIVGEGPERAALEAQANSLGTSDLVTFTGRRDDMPAVYASLDLLVSSSRIEGLPMGLLEAMASRLPIVATAVGDVPQLIEDRVTGLLVTPENPSALAAAMAELTDNTRLARTLSEAAFQRVESEFSARRMAADYLAAYESAIAAAD